jgi:hypothetical protein
VLRKQPKGFSQRRPDFDKPGEWIWNLKGASRLPYRLPELVAADTVFIVEGEKDVDALVETARECRLAYAASCNSGGAGNWQQELNKWFAGKTVYIIPNNDEPGHKHAVEVAENLCGIAREVRIVNLPDLPKKKGADFSDWLRAGGDTSKLVDMAKAAPVWEREAPASNGAAQSEQEGFPFVGYEDLQIDIAKPWIVKNVIARGETSSWIAGPGMGKSALLTDIAIHVAAGRDWRGYRNKQQLAVIYFAFERGDLLKCRLEAYKRKHNLHDLPIAVVTASVDIMSPKCVALIVATIRAVEKHYLQREAGFIIFDTYAKAIAVGGGDEDKAKDQNRALGHFRQVQEETGTHVAFVGHTGKDESRGARGSSAHLGDADVMIQLSGEAVKTATIIKANDQPLGVLTSFTLEPFELGIDEDGDSIDVGIVSGEIPEAAKQSKKARRGRQSDRDSLALKALRDALADAGELAPASNHIPQGARVVTVALWRKYAYQRGISSEDTSDARKKAFQRALEALQAENLIGIWEPHVWTIHEA